MALAIAASNNGVLSVASASHSAPLPSGSGGLLIVAVNFNGSQQPTATPTGWTELALLNNGTQDGVAIWAKQADGTEGSSLSFSTSGNSTGTYQSWRISGARTTNPPTSAEIAASIQTHASTLNADPPTLTPSWGSEENLWFVFTTVATGGITVTGFPTGYNLAQLFQSTGGAGSGTGMAVAAKLATAASDNPGTFTASGASSGVNAVLAIRPAAGGVTKMADHYRRLRAA